MGIAKKYRLKSRKLIEELMEKGTRFKAFPLHMVFYWRESETPSINIAVTVPKRIHSSAVTRNAIKRMMREQMRSRIPELEALCIDQKRSLSLMLMYLGDRSAKSVDIQDRISILLSRLKEDSLNPSDT